MSFLIPPLVVQMHAAENKSVAQAKAQKHAPLPEGVERRAVTIWSDGTRMAGDLYLPAKLASGEKLPAIVFIAGTGGTKKGTPDRMGPLFASSGFIFLAFDYRGWGESDSKLMLLGPMPEPDGKGEVNVTARAIRWQMDFADQSADIRAAISFVSGEPNVDPTRIGILGTSYGGGLATWTAGNDPRVHCAAVQVPGMGGGKPPSAESRAYEMLTRQARGEIEPVPFEQGAPGGKMAAYAHMRYNPAKGIGFDVLKAAEKITIPMLILDAENEELMSTAENGRRVAEILRSNRTVVDYEVIPGIGHYGVYGEKFQEVTAREINWFKRHLGLH